MSDNDELWQRRFMQLVYRYRDDEEGLWGWKSRLAELLQQDPSTINKLVSEARPVTKGLVTAAITKLNVDPRYFYDAKLGSEPDYNDFIGKTYYTVLDEEHGAPAVEAFIAGQASIGRPLLPEAQRALRRTFYKTAEITQRTVESSYEDWKASEAMKRLERPTVQAEPDTDRGQRSLDVSKIPKKA